MTTTAPYLTRREVAGLVKITETTVSEWAKRGRIPQPVRIGQKLLFPRAATLRALGLGDDPAAVGEAS